MLAMKKHITHFLLLFLIIGTYNNCAPSFIANGDFATNGDTGGFGDGSDGSFGGGDSPAFKNAPEGVMPATSFRKLTNNELYNKIKVGFKIDINVESFLGEETLSPFNNTIKDQIISENLINNLEFFARRLSEEIFKSDQAKKEVFVCNPQSATDLNCLSKITSNVFDKAFTTRPASSTTNQLNLKAIELSKESGNFDTAVDSILMFTFQSPRFVYTEYGSGSVSGTVYTLSDIEFANKMSYLITGAPADSQLIDKALTNSLQDSSTLAFEIERLFDKPEATRQLLNFHSMWFGYYQSQLPPVIAVNAIQETQKVLKEHIIDQNKSWIDLLKLDYTYVNDALAAHYGFPTQGSKDFYKINYKTTNQPRMGIFSHATFLSAFPKIGDSSPSKRGYNLIKGLLCDKIGQPPANVDLDELPPPTNGGKCKKDSHLALMTNPACASCHIKMDGIGLGLENFNHLGQYRTVEHLDKSCQIDGEGEIYNIGKFTGLIGFSNALYNERTIVQNCLVEKASLFAFGFDTKEVNPVYLKSLQRSFTLHGSYKNLIRDIIMSNEFKQIVWK